MVRVLKFCVRLTLRRTLEQRIELLGPFFVAKVETQCLKTITTFNRTTHFSALGKVVDVVGYYHMRVKGMTAHFAGPLLIIKGVGVVSAHGFDLSH